MTSKINMKMIKPNAFFIPPPGGQTMLPITASKAKLGTKSGLTLTNNGRRKCAAMMFTSFSGCASCHGTNPKKN